jgi:DNA-binding LytR/AlgR family response regulator
MLTCFVIDDEPLATKLIEDHINKISFLKLNGVYTSPIEALLAFNKEPVDLIFLDIQMNELNGLQFMELLNNRAQVIVASAYQEYAFAGFEHNVIDYLLKPIGFDRFYRAAEKAYKQKRPGALLVQQEMTPSTSGFIFVKVETKLVRVELDNIQYIEGQSHYVFIYTKTERIMSLQVMKQLEEVLNPNRFVRVHKSYIVAFDKIISVERQEIYIMDKIIPIGKTYLSNFSSLLENRKA